MFILFYLNACGPLQPDGRKLSVILTFSYVKEKGAIFPANNIFCVFPQLCEINFFLNIIILSYYTTIYDIKEK